MNKELYVSSTPHETKVALVEDDQLAEVYFERENEYTLAGSIYKGRVTRVLPGMQSAFVDIGLDRDAFLYVSDFLELQDEDDEFGDVEVGPIAPIELKQQDVRAGAPVESAAEIEEEGSEEADEGEELDAADAADGEEANAAPGTAGSDEAGARRWRGRRRRRGRRGGRERLPEQQRSADAAELSPEEQGEVANVEDLAEPEEVLPSRSLKTKHRPTTNDSAGRIHRAL